MRSLDVRPRSSLAPTAGAAGLALALLAVGCGDDGGPGERLPETIDECGSALGELLARESGGAPRLAASYTEALAEWRFPDGSCGVGVLRGVCADGKQVLYRSGGFTSEIRYYDGEQLVGYVGSTDVGYCPSVCPFSHYYGTLANVRCEAPTFESLCASLPDPGADASVRLPFADGQPPGGCEPGL